MRRRRQHKTLQSRFDPFLEHCRRELIRIQELPRETERVPYRALAADNTELACGTERKPSMTKGRWSN